MFKNCWLWQMFLECVSNGIIAHDFSKRSKFEFFWEKNGLFRKRALKDFKIAHGGKLFEKVSQPVLLLKNSRNLHFFVFFLKRNGFFRWKVLEFFKIADCENVSRMRIKRYYCLWFSKTFKNWVFLGNKWGIPIKGLEMFQVRSLWQICLETSQMALLIESSQNVQNFLVFFENEPWNVSKTLIVTNVARMRLKN